MSKLDAILYSIFFFGFFIFLMGAGIYFLIILPLVCIIDCYKDKIETFFIKVPYGIERAVDGITRAIENIKYFISSTKEAIKKKLHPERYWSTDRVFMDLDEYEFVDMHPEGDRKSINQEMKNRIAL